MKITQYSKVKKILLNTGKVSRNELVNNRTTLRLGAYINDLRNEGYEIDTKMENNDCVYYLIEKPKTLQTVTERDERGAIIRAYQVLK